MIGRKYKTVVVFDNGNSDEWPPIEAAGFFGWFHRKLDLIPQEYRATASIELDSVSGYEGNHYAHIRITYERLETDFEMSCRENKITAMPGTQS
jgi:hypothetical protein